MTTDDTGGDVDLWSWLPPAQARVECAGEFHWIRWESGQLIPLNHSDVAGERALAALGRQQIGCFELLDLWNRHRADLRVLALSSRGPGDPLGTNAVVSGQPPPVQTLSASTTVAGPMLAQARTGGSWFGYGAPPSRPLTGSRFSRPVRVAAGPLDDPLARLIALSGPLADRLAATVAAAWEERERAGGADVAAAKPAMIAALHGRATSAMRTWLGAPGLEVKTTLVDTQHAGAERDLDGAVHVSLPFSWIRTVWATGLSTVLGRFTLRVLNSERTRVILETLGPEFGPSESLSITVHERS